MKTSSLSTDSPSKQTRTGAELLCQTLRAGGVEMVCGVPGTQNISIYEAIRTTGMRSVLTTSELQASFLANGYFRASGKVCPILTIPGPGFTYALTGLGEANHDSAAVILITGQPRSREKKFQFQSIDQATIAGPLVKEVISIDDIGEVAAKTAQALETALHGEPGPVLLDWATAAMVGVPSGEPATPTYLHPALDADKVKAAAAQFAGARKPLLFVGAGAADASKEVIRLAELTGAAVLATTSGRGIVPEDHRLALAFDYARSDGRTLGKVIEESDCILVLGAKLTAAATSIFHMALPQEKLIHVDASAQVVGANYPTKIGIVGRVEKVLAELLPEVERLRKENGVKTERTEAEIGAWRQRLVEKNEEEAPDPTIQGVPENSPKELFQALRRALPRDAIVVSDSGTHQHLVRRYFDVYAPRGLIVPTDFQSMGFGLPSAIGAKLAAPGRTVVAVVGDGAFAMSGMELLTAVREKLALTVIVLNDGRLNKIRLQQFSAYGQSQDVDLHNPDFQLFAEAMGAKHLLVENGNAEEVFRKAATSTDVTLVEVLVGDSRATHTMRARGFTRHNVRKALGPRLIGSLKRIIKRR